MESFQEVNPATIFSVNGYRLNYLNHVHSNVSAHHHRNLANTDDGALDFHCRKSQARCFSVNGEGINQLKSWIHKYFSGIITATLLAQLIVRLTFKSGGLEVKHQTIFFSLFFLKGNTSINLSMYTKTIPHIITAV